MTSELESLFSRQSVQEKRGSKTFPLQTPPFRNGCRVYRNSAQSISNNALNYISFNSVRFNYSTDSTLMWVVGAPTRFTCVVPGVYLMIGHVTWAASTAGVRALFWYLGGATYLASSETLPLTTAGFTTRQSVPAIYQLAVGNYVELGAYQNSGGPLNVTNEANCSAEAEIWRLV